MIDLLRDLSYLILVWCIALTIIYGAVESILFMPFRVGFASLGESGWWGETFVYCPLCTGFWVFGICGSVGYLDLVWFVKMAAIGTASLLVSRAMGGDLVIGRPEIEGPAIEKMREMPR